MKTIITGENTFDAQFCGSLSIAETDSATVKFPPTVGDICDNLAQGKCSPVTFCHQFCVL